MNDLDFIPKSEISNKSQEICIKECQDIVFQETKEVSKDLILDTLLDMIDSVKISDSAVHIKFNKSLIIQSENIVLGADNLNIQLAGNRVELQPRIKNPKEIK
ncbi:TPA: hypothetical protein SB288_001678 [Campylobacter coli]|nr:hypothetical protein [Campylobacter coli]